MHIVKHTKVIIVEEVPITASKVSNRRVLITVLVVLMALASVSFMAVYQVMKSEAYARYMGVLNVSSERIAKIIRGAEMNANNIFEDVSNHLDNPESVIAALKGKANLNLDVRGYFAAFEPDYFPEKGTWFEPYIYQPEYGGFEYRQVGSARHNYTKSPWYIQAKAQNLSFWSDPYYYYDGTSMSGHYCTFVKPIYDSKGDLACICGADLKFGWLLKELEWINEMNKSSKVLNKYHLFQDYDYNTIILNNDGTCVENPEGKTITVTDKEVLNNLVQKKTGVANIDIDGKACTMFYGPIEFVNWTTAIVVPNRDFLKPMLPIGCILLSIVVIGMIIVWFVCKKR